MKVDLLLDLDDDLVERLEWSAVAEGSTVEEIIRRRLMAAVGDRYDGPVETVPTDDRLVLKFDLRTP